MRRWTVTLGLTATAAAALLVAPRLLPAPVVTSWQVPSAPDVQPPEADPVVTATPTPDPDPLPLNRVEPAPQVRTPIRTTDAIPEVDAPAVEPDPLPDEFWRDAVDCGMG